MKSDNESRDYRAKCPPKPAARPRKLNGLFIKGGICASALIGSQVKCESGPSHIYPPDKPLVWTNLSVLEQNAITHEAEQRRKYWDQAHHGDLNPPPVEEIREEILKSPQNLPDMVQAYEDYSFTLEKLWDIYGQTR